MGAYLFDTVTLLQTCSLHHERRTSQKVSSRFTAVHTCGVIMTITISQLGRPYALPLEASSPSVPGPVPSLLPWTSAVLCIQQQ
jgi:hypothetical protein